MFNLIGLTGKAGSGKDTAATIFVKNGFRMVAIGDFIREAALALDPLIRGYDTYEPLSYFVDKLGWDEAKAIPDVRRTLQRLGTEAGTDLHGPNLWLDKINYRDGEKVVISDIRKPSETEWLQNNGGVLIEIFRNDLPDLGLNADHVTEQGAGVANLYLYNNGTIADLEENIKAMFFD